MTCWKLFAVFLEVAGKFVEMKSEIDLELVLEMDWNLEIPGCKTWNLNARGDGSLCRVLCESMCEDFVRVCVKTL